MKKSLIILNILLVLEALIVLALGYAFYTCHNLPYYGGAIIVGMMAMVVLMVATLMGIFSTIDILKTEKSMR